MTYLIAIIASQKFSSKFGGIRGINHLCYEWGRARVMLDIGAGHSNNCQVILKLFGYVIFCNSLQHKKN